MPALKSEETVRPKAGIMIGKRGSRGLLGRVKNVSADSKAPVNVSGQDTRVLEAFLAADSEASRPKKCRINDDANEEEEEDEIQPIGYEARPEPKVKPRIGDTSSVSAVGRAEVAVAVPRVLGPAVPADLKELTASVDPRPRPSREVEEEIAAVSRVDHSLAENTTSAEDVEGSSEKKLRGDRGSRRRKKPEEEEEEKVF